MRNNAPTVCLFGPESTGKTTLAQELSGQLGAIFVPEYGRFYCEAFGNKCDADDLRAIVAGHTLLARAARRKARAGLVILDTDAVMTVVWASVLLGQRPADLDRVDEPADLYLLAEVDVPFAADTIRYFPDQPSRARLFGICREELDRRKLPYVLISGDHAQRLATALKAIRARFGIALPT